ncbi:hypothetical protein ACRQTN_14345 [Pectobacterium brasiliense]|uniref:hypothetical protein n=1 Tax=Pectobacterium brasiliense TaxID=180957 RepID=UPI003EBE97AC
MSLKVIPFDYCSLERASKFFNYEIDDFFHWHETKKISICLKPHDYRASLLSINNRAIEFHTPYLGSNHIEYDLMASMGNEFSYTSEQCTFIGNALVFDELCNIYRVEGHAFDFWKPCDIVIDTLRKGGRIIDDFSASPYSCENDFRIMIKVVEGFQHSDPDAPFIQFYPEITVNDLVLHKTDLEIVNRLISGISGCPKITDTQEINVNKSHLADDTLNNKEEKNNDNQIDRVTKKQSQFVVSLLYKLGISRNDLKGSITLLRQKIAKVAPDAPVPEDDKSLIDWLRKGGVDR